MRPNGRDDQLPWYFQEEIVSRYESWYTGKKGERMDHLEKRLLLGLLGEFGKGKVESLLEVGCGTTHFTRWFESLGIEAVGLDLSEVMLAEARRWWRGPLVQGDAAALPFANKSFDVVAFIACFEYMPDPLRVLREARRVARKGLLLGLMNRWSLTALRRRVQELLGRNPFYKDAHFYSLPEIKRLIAQAFKDERERPRLRWSSTLFPPIPGFPQEARLPFGAFLGLAVAFPPQAWTEEGQSRGRRG
ncbi:TPA: class I SAM-dependent methyltransferase [Candidatus Bipolaricaulota bacterium]|nr:class I SAM-dependent methyltransferase [Candidatus Bipolaricaulota bacterium]